jgi:NADPH:quinone reductase-like Zn-dependent oxidoreductase
LTGQAAQHGVLNGNKDLGLPIISVRCVSPDRKRSDKMKAIVYYNYGSPDVLELQEIDKPVVSDDDVLVRVRAAGINPLDWHFMRGEPYFMRPKSGLLRPGNQRLGADFAGEVEAVGKSVTQFQPGDEVFGTQYHPGAALCAAGDRAFAEYLCTSEDALVTKPPNLTFEQAAAAPVAALTALQGLRDKGRVQPGQKVLIDGASGGVGTFAAQIAKSFGAEVTAVCSTRNVDMVRSTGADRVIDYTQEDFTLGEQRYDLMFDTVGNRSLSECRGILASGGTYLLVGMRTGRWLRPLPRVLTAAALSPLVSNKMVLVNIQRSKEDLLALRELLEAGKVTSVIDRHYKLSGVPKAIRYLEEGHAQGKVVITV